MRLLAPDIHMPLAFYVVTQLTFP